MFEWKVCLCACVYTGVCICVCIHVCICVYINEREAAKTEHSTLVGNLSNTFLVSFLLELYIPPFTLKVFAISQSLARSLVHNIA